jgi:hypothetical protein
MNDSDLSKPKRHQFARGTDHRSARLDPAKVQAIRQLPRTGLNFATIAARYSVSRGAVQAVLTGRTWRHVPHEP